MYEGFLEFSNTEIVNAERTEAYVQNIGEGVSIQRLFRTDKLHLANEEKEYESPLIDAAPWSSDSDPATSDFFGLYPLEIEGIDGSTMGSQVTEHIDDGGSHGLQRDASRAVRVHGLIVAASREGAEAGLSWLGEAVRSSDCGLTTSCGAGDLRYYLAEPDVDPNAFGEEESTSSDKEFFGDLAAPELLTYRWPTDMIPLGMPARVRWAGSAAEGTAFRYGAYSRLSMDVLYDSGIIMPLRRNYGLNPGVSSSLLGWSYTAGTGAMDYVLAVPDVAAHGRVTADDTDGVDRASTVSTTTLPVTAGVYTASVALRGTPGFQGTLEVLTSDGVTSLGIASVPLTADFQRVGITVTVPANGALLVRVSSNDDFDFTQLLVEMGTRVRDYFDGDTEDTDEYTSYWTGAAQASIAQRDWLGAAELAWPDSNFRPFLRLLAGTLTNVQLEWWRRDPITIAEQLDPYERTLHEVQCTQGPQVLNRWYKTGVGFFIEVDMIFVAGNPHPYSPGVTLSTFPLANQPYVDPEDDASVDDVSWLVDPDGLAITTPVSAPVVLDPSLRHFTSWQRYYVQIPASAVQAWGQSVPTIGINSKATAIKQVRMRFHANPFEYDAPRVDPLAYCGEVVLSYLPATTRIEIDGITRSAIASKGGKATVAADHLLYGSDGAPVGWPELSCGIPYVLTIDIPAGSSIDAFDVDLVIRRRG